jgi:hypothetical protein
MDILGDGRTVWERLGGDQDHIVAKYAAWGGLIGLAIYGPFGLTASMCECMLFDYNPTIGIGILLAFMAAGTIFGAFIGSFVGAGELGNITHLYTEGVRRGGALVVVQTTDDLASSAMSILRQEHALGVKAYQTWPKLGRGALGSGHL